MITELPIPFNDVSDDNDADSSQKSSIKAPL